LAILCHRIGKTLPSPWQNFAIALAKVCQRQGKELAKLRSNKQQVKAIPQSHHHIGKVKGRLS
jgi:hypothetical protein